METGFIPALYPGKNAETKSSRNSGLENVENAEVEKFASLVEIMGIEPPERGVKERWHVSVVGFGVRVAAPRKSDGMVRRTWIARCDELQPDGSYKDAKPTLGLVKDICNGDTVLSYDQAEKKARELVEQSKRRKAGGSVRLTVAAAWDLLREELASPASLDAPTYKQKIESIYTNFLAHLGAKFLDQMHEGTWRKFGTQLRAGTLRVGDDTAGKPIYRHAKSASYTTAILNVASRLYATAHVHQGIEDKAKDWDPTRDFVNTAIEAPNERDGHVHFEHLAQAWLATDQLIPPWWRDLWRVYLLTGLRDRLVMDMQWNRLDLDKGIYYIMPLQQGTKRRRRNLSQKERLVPLEMPLSTYVVDLLKRRKALAPKDNPWVWYSPEQIAAPAKALTPKQQEQRAKKAPRPPAERLTDPRASWKRLTPVIGYWVYKHDLRRTYASLGATLDSGNVLALSLLLLHSSKTISKALQVPAITVKYIKAQQFMMRQTTERITQGVLELVGERPRTALTDSLKEYLELPEHVARELRREDNQGAGELPAENDGLYEGGENSDDYELPAAA